ncbi:MAG TPA: hypothetical protein VMV50_03205 [Candidatus Paceibacterota bacterium]|nr:hypothetical protein [Candidatus Paceibacterota bacterium]
MQSYVAVLQLWRRGARRGAQIVTVPDGCSLHLGHSQRRRFIIRYVNALPVPIPFGRSIPWYRQGQYVVPVSMELFMQLVASDDGIRAYSGPFLTALAGREFELPFEMLF